MRLRRGGCREAGVESGRGRFRGWGREHWPFDQISFGDESVEGAWTEIGARRVEVVETGALEAVGPELRDSVGVVTGGLEVNRPLLMGDSNRDVVRDVLREEVERNVLAAFVCCDAACTVWHNIGIVLSWRMPFLTAYAERDMIGRLRTATASVTVVG